MRKSAMFAIAAALAAWPMAVRPAPAPPAKAWQPPAGLEQIPLWPDSVAIARPELKGPESMRVGTRLIGGKTVTGIDNVAKPTMTIFPPKGRNSSVALFVYPGGGYQGLAIDLEGSEVCDWATPLGITCVLLKYRVPQTWWPGDGKGQRPPVPQMALQDAERAMGLLRQRAASLGIDPHKTGVLGFSAGGHLATAISNASERNYAPVDAADALSARPDFAVPLYPGHLWAMHALELYPWNPIRADGPPTFIVQAEDDPVDDVRNSIVYFLALREREVPVEMHIFAHGGHAFGLRETAEPITRWPALLETWLHGIGML